MQIHRGEFPKFIKIRLNDGPKNFRSPHTVHSGDCKDAHLFDWSDPCIEPFNRFRVNFHLQKGSVEGAFRRIPIEIPTVEKLGLPQIIKDLARKPNGLVLVTGPTGMGKTTTLAAMIDLINSEQECLITCIEDPIEFIYLNKKSIIKQREVYSDTRTFAEALRHALRQDPNVIVVGEMRDLETIQLAVSAAETGHLVFGTLHTSSASQTVDRMVDVFPPEQQGQIRVQLSNSLVAVLSQTLVQRHNPQPGQFGRVMAQEIMIVTPAISNLIREGKTAQMYGFIQTGGKESMQTLESVLAKLYMDGDITFESAMSKTSRPEELLRVVGPNPPPVMKRKATGDIRSQDMVRSRSISG